MIEAARSWIEKWGDCDELGEMAIRVTKVKELHIGGVNEVQPSEGQG